MWSLQFLFMFLFLLIQRRGVRTEIRGRAAGCGRWDGLRGEVVPTGQKVGKAGETGSEWVLSAERHCGLCWSAALLWLRVEGALQC
jgi:hypothetical protein